MHLSLLTVSADTMWIAGSSVGLLFIGVAMKSFFTTKAVFKVEILDGAHSANRVKPTSPGVLCPMKPSLTKLTKVNGPAQSARSPVDGLDEFCFMVSQMA
jgi:hypothetical protein